MDKPELGECTPVVVLWVDSTLQEGWGTYRENVSLDCITIGHLFRENDEVVVVALSRHSSSYGSYMTIPRAAVKSIKRLVLARSQRSRRHASEEEVRAEPEAEAQKEGSTDSSR